MFLVLSFLLCVVSAQKAFVGQDSHGDIHINSSGNASVFVDGADVKAEIFTFASRLHEQSSIISRMDAYVFQLKEMDTITVTGFTGCTKWSTGVLSRNGKIYGIPCSSTSVLIIDQCIGGGICLSTCGWCLCLS